MAEEERTEQAPAPRSVSDIIADLKGFGIENYEDVLILKSGKREVQIKIANMTTEEENLSLVAVEEFKGYTWMQKVKCEILSRSISWINEIDIRNLAPIERLVVDPRDGQQKDIQIVLRNMLEGWGQEHMAVLWKVLMVHSQSIEDRLLNSFPEVDIMTDAERRLTERARAEIDASTREVIDDQVARLAQEDDSEEQVKD